MYIVRYMDRYDNSKVVGVFDSREKVFEVLRMIYEKEKEEFPDEDLAEDYFSDGYFLGDWFDIEIIEVEVNKIYLN